MHRKGTVRGWAVRREDKGAQIGRFPRRHHARAVRTDLLRGRYLQKTTKEAPEMQRRVSSRITATVIEK